jgi:iron complex outermembrane recepter protein
VRLVQLCAFGWIVCFGAFVARAQAVIGETADKSIEIPAGDLVVSLERLAKMSGLEFVYDADQLKGIRTQGVSGRMTVRQAVNKLLEATGLVLIEHPDGAILIAAPRAGGREVGGSATSAPADIDAAQHQRSQEAPPKTARDSVLSEIIVTGTHIRGETPVGSSLASYTRAEMEQSGSATLEQFARTMPENYAATDALSTVNTNGNAGFFQQGAANNVFGGAGFNLKGLGPGSTLTLLNGHRLAAGGLDGSIVDISQIPLTAIDHLEVLDDGASAIYGADAVAGVVNIITRHDFDGADTGLRYGRSTQGGAAEYTASQILGKSWRSGNVLFDYEYDDQGGLDASQRSWIAPQGGPFSLIPENRRNSFYLAGGQDIGGDAKISTDTLYSDRSFQSTGIQNPPSGLTDQHLASAGSAAQTAVSVTLDQALFGDWASTISANYSSIRQSETIGTDALSGAPTKEQLTTDASVVSLDAHMNGSLFNISGEPVKASVGASLRRETFKSNDSNETTAAAVSRARQVTSAYFEVIAPVLVSTRPWAHRLEFSLACRSDYYSDVYSDTNPKLGWLWEPTSGIRLKGTFGTSFRAPLLFQLGAPVTSYTALFPAGGVQGGYSDVLIINGGDSNLVSERSQSITLGLEFEPAAIKELIASINAFHVLYKNRIEAQNILPEPIASQPQLFAFVGNNPGLASVQSYFDSPGFQGDNAGRGAAGVGYTVDDQFANTAATVESGLSVAARYRWPTEHGQVDFSLAGVYLLSDRIQIVVFQPEFDVANGIGEPPKLKARGGVGWTTDRAVLNLTLNYVNAYQNTLFSPPQTIGSWTTADFYAGYSTRPNAQRFLNNVQVGLSIQNVTDQKPPYLRFPAGDLAPGRNAIPFDGSNASPVGRFIALQFKKSW